LDIYFEDTYSLPRKQLPCDVPGNYANLPNEKVMTTGLLKFSQSF